MDCFYEYALWLEVMRSQVRSINLGPLTCWSCVETSLHLLPCLQGCYVIDTITKGFLTTVVHAMNVAADREVLNDLEEI